MTQDYRLSAIRTLMLAVLVLGMAGLLTELLLIAHFEDTAQWIPIILLAVGLIVVAADVVLAAGWTQVAIQLTMVLMIGASALGMYFHFRGSREFQIEMDPQMHGANLVWHVLRAKSPPTLAPGSMLQLGLLGLGYAYLRRPQ